MIYECDLCEEHLSPHAPACPRCGQKFDTPVPSDAEPPPNATWHVPPPVRGKSAAARATIVLSGSPDESRTVSPRRPSLLKTLLGAVLPISDLPCSERSQETTHRMTKIKH